MSQNDVQGMQPSGQKHRMSIALTIGATIGLIGLVLLLYGLFGHADYSRSDGININLWWGLLMFVFGIVMAAIGYISSHRQATNEPAALAKEQ
ncbi:MAG TPA: hypothetical protein VFB12_07465 [Ktedonobacteraceae bacterium]|nr:hypothetical protein [Ktedonobacteraceae bacterium]